MFRHILLATLLIFSGLTYSQHVRADDERVMPTSDDRWTHWPWRLAQPFPWSDIQGTWKVEQDDYVSYFIFKVVQLKNGVKQVQVKQFDGANCRQIATGVGIEKGSLVFAQMTSKSGKIYRLNLTAFKRSDSPQPPLQGGVYTESVMVLSMGEISQQNLEDMIHMQIVKISAHLDQRACLQDVNN